MRGWHRESQRHALAARGIRTNINPSRTRRDGRYGVMVNGHFYDFTDDVMEAKEIAREVGGYIVYFTEDPDPDRDRRNEIDRRRCLQEHVKWEEAWRNWRR